MTMSEMAGGRVPGQYAAVGLVDGVRYGLLGPLTVSAGGDALNLGGPKQRLVLALLLADVGAVLTPDRLIDGIWGDDAPARARHTLQAYVSELRSVLEDPIEWTGSGYRVAVEADQVDSVLFELLLGRGRQALPDDPDSAAATLADALSLWRGEPFADLRDAPGLQSEIRRLQQLRLAALEERIDADLALGRHRHVADELETLTREFPFRERFRAQHMVAVYRCGRQAEALRAFAKTAAFLAEELGVDPSRKLQRLQEQILRQDPALDAFDPPIAVGPAARTTDPGDPALFGRAIRGFELRELIGRGPGTVVYRTYQASVGREVAVKVIGPEIAGHPDFVRRFEAEAQLVADLEHPHVMALHDFWRDPDGAYLVVPWLRGGSVARGLERGRWSLAAALRVVEQIGAALAYAHRRGVPHGAVSPNNVLLDEDDNAYLADFGVASGSNRRRLDSGVAWDRPSGVTSAVASDVSAFGVLIHRLLSGPAPDRDALAPIAGIRDDVPADLDRVLLRATAPNPADRYRRVEDLLRELRGVLGVDVVGVAARPAEEPLVVRNPYKGLRAFQESDASDFFGRDDLIERLLETVQQHRLVAVVGPSGSGKSSLVRAGLIPALRSGALPGSDAWLVTDMFPGAYPFEELATALWRVAVQPTDGMLDELTGDDHGLLRVTKRALPGEDTQLVLLIDQFEELFSMTTDAELRRLFLDSLTVVTADPRGRVRVVITLRADFFDRPLEFHAFGSLLETGLVPVTVPSEEGLALAISRPARLVGLELEQGLVAEIVRDVIGQPGGLPLLQHALTELVDRRRDRLLTFEAYLATGGVAGALGRRAEEVFGSLIDSEQHAAERVLLRLVAVNESGEDARRRVRRTELAALDIDPAALDHVLQRFGAHRLLSFDRDPVTRGATVEVAHEALLGRWSRLDGWVADRREDLVLHRRLDAAVREWEGSGHEVAFLLGGGRLEQFASWAAATDLPLTQGEREFLSASRNHEDSARAHRRRRRAGLIAALSTLTVVAVVAAAVAVNQTRAVQVRSLIAAATANVGSDPELALILATEAVETARGSALHDATAVLHETLLATPLVRSFPGTGHIAWSHSTNLLAALEEATDQATVSIRDGSTSEEIATLTPGFGPISGMAWSGDGRLLAVTHEVGPAVIWERATGQILAEIPAIRAGGHAFPSFGAGDTLLAVSDLPGDAPCCRSDSVVVWDLERNTELGRVALDTAVFGTHLSPVDALLLVSEPETFRASIWDVHTGDKAIDLGDQGHHNDFVRFSPDGSRAAVLGPEQVKVWDIASAELFVDLPAGSGSLDLEWSPDGGLIATTGTDAVVRVFDVEAGTEIRSLRGAGGRIEDLEFGPNGREMATLSDDIRIWDLQPPGGTEVAAYATGRLISHAAWTPDRSRVVTTAADGRVEVIDATSGEVLASIMHPTPQDPPPGPLPPPAKVVVSPDGRIIATTLHGTRTLIIDATTLKPLTVLAPGGTPGSFSPDSRHLIVGDFEAAYLYDTRVWHHMATLRNRDPSPFFTWYYDVAFHPQADVVFVADANDSDRSLTVWDISAEPERMAELSLDAAATMVSISADGRRVAAGDFASGAVRVWDVEAVLAGRDPASAVVLDIHLRDFLTGAVLNRDGTSLVTTLDRGELAVWDVDRGERLYALVIPDGLPNEPEFSTDGDRLLVHTGSGTVHELTLDVDELIDIARSRVARPLTDQECRIHLGGACPSAAAPRG